MERCPRDFTNPIEIDMKEIRNLFIQKFGKDNLSPQMEWLLAILEQHDFQQDQYIQNLSNRLYNLGIK